MFESLSDRLNGAFTRLQAKGRLDEGDIDDAMKEVRRALLEADVNFKVVKSFVDRVREKAIGQEVLKSLTPAQMVVGLQGSGKTTTAAKLALQMRRNGQSPLLVAADVYRPAAVHQLQTLGKQLGVPVYAEPPGTDPVSISVNAVRHA